MCLWVSQCWLLAAYVALASGLRERSYSWTGNLWTSLFKKCKKKTQNHLKFTAATLWNQTLLERSNVTFRTSERWHLFRWCQWMLCVRNDRGRIFSHRREAPWLMDQLTETLSANSSQGEYRPKPIGDVGMRSMSSKQEIQRWAQILCWYSCTLHTQFLPEKLTMLELRWSLGGSPTCNCD